MKKGILFSAFLLMALMVLSVKPSSATSVDLEVLYLEPTNMDTSYASQDYFPAGTNPTVNLKLESVDHPYAPAYRLGVEFQGWHLSYLSFSDDEKDSITSNSATDDIFIATSHPDLSAQSCNLCTISADSEIKFRTLSFYRDVPLSQSGSFTANYRVGLKYISLERDLDVLMDVASSTANDYKDTYNMDTSAFGLTGGVNGNWVLSNALNFGFDIGLSLLYGSTDGKYKFTTIRPSGTCVNDRDCYVIKWGKDTITPMLDMALRLSYSVMDNLNIYAAYNLIYLANVGTIQEFVDDVDEIRNIQVNQALGFHGPSVGVRYLIGGN